MSEHYFIKRKKIDKLEIVVERTSWPTEKVLVKCLDDHNSIPSYPGIFFIGYELLPTWGHKTWRKDPDTKERIYYRFLDKPAYPWKIKDEFDKLSYLIKHPEEIENQVQQKAKKFVDELNLLCKKHQMVLGADDYERDEDGERYIETHIWIPENPVDDNTFEISYIRSPDIIVLK